MHLRKTLLSGLLASSLVVGGATALAQDSTPATETVDASATPIADLTQLEGLVFIDADGNTVGNAEVREEDGGGVWFSIISAEDSGMAEGKYGVHVHESGVCDPDAAFESAGEHFNPGNDVHGDVNADPSHAGDLGNLEADGEGMFEHEVVAEGLTMQRDEMNSIADDDGSAIIIHAGEDDLVTDPSGESGDRWACAVVFLPLDGLGTPAATPQN